MDIVFFFAAPIPCITFIHLWILCSVSRQPFGAPHSFAFDVYTGILRRYFNLLKYVTTLQHSQYKPKVNVFSRLQNTDSMVCTERTHFDGWSMTLNILNYAEVQQRVYIQQKE